MFSLLFDNFLPEVGKFFGSIVSIASSPYSDVVAWFDNTSFIAVNFFTGENFIFSCPAVLATPIRIILTPVSVFLQNLGIDTSLPFWLYILAFSVGVPLFGTLILKVINAFSRLIGGILGALL